MALTIAHATQAVGTDAGNGEIGKQEWNESHSITLATNKLIGRATAGTGVAEEIAIGSRLSMAGGTLNVNDLPVTAINPMNTNKLLGRSTASTGAAEEITIGTNLSLTAGTLDTNSTLIQTYDLVKISRSGGAIVDLLDYNNVSILQVQNYTWAQFIHASFDLTTARYVTVTDRHSSNDGVVTAGSLWKIDPTGGTGRKRILMSGALYYATYAAAVAEVPPASWPGLKIFVPVGVGLGGAELVSNGTRYRHVTRGQVLMAATTATDTITTNKNTEKIELQWAIPAGFLAVGDIIIADSHFSKSGTTNFMARDFHIGTAGTTADTSMMNVTPPGGADVRVTGTATNVGSDERKAWQILSTTTMQRFAPIGSLDYNGFNGSSRDLLITIPNITSNALYLSAGYWLSGGTADTIKFEAAAIYLEMRS